MVFVDVTEQRRRARALDEQRALQNIVGGLQGIAAKQERERQSEIAQADRESQLEAQRRREEFERQRFEATQGLRGRELDIKEKQFEQDQERRRRQLERQQSQEARLQRREQRAIEKEQRQIEREKRKEARLQNKAPSSKEFQAATFAKRLEQAEDVFGDLERKGFESTSLKAAGERILPEFLQGEDVKKQQQAERNFVNAVLRRESGAAISESEFDSAQRQYFPRPGDTSEVLAQKARNRAVALAALKAEAGKALTAVEQQLASQAVRDGQGNFVEQPVPSQQAAQQSPVGRTVIIRGQRYQVAEDGDTLIPLGQ